MRLDGWEQRDEGHAGPMIRPAGRCVLLHTMESDNFQGSMDYLSGTGQWPQLCYDPRDRRKVQGIDTDLAGKALANLPGGVETNRWGVLQVEMPGRADETHDWPDDWLRNIAEDLIGPLHRLGLCQLHAPEFVGREAGFIARVDAPQRLSHDAWRAFDGVCGHQHAPENDHWDPGRLNVPRILALATGSPAASTNGGDMLYTLDEQTFYAYVPTIGFIGSSPPLRHSGIPYLVIDQAIFDRMNAPTSRLPASGGGGLTEVQVRAIVATEVKAALNATTIDPGSPRVKRLKTT